MWEKLLAGLGGSALGLIGGWINRGYNERRQDYLMDKQFGQTKELMHMQNVYNSPKSQMSRLKEAGLNPNLIYGGGSAVMASAGGSAPSPSPQGNGPIDTQGVLQMVNLIVNSMLEKDRISAQKDMQGEQIRAQKDLQSEQLQSTKELQESSLAHQAEQGSLNRESSEKMASASLEENQRQFNERIAEEIRQFNLNYEQAQFVAQARLNIDNYLASLKGSETASQLKTDGLNRKYTILLNDMALRLQYNDLTTKQLSAVAQAITTKSSLGADLTSDDIQGICKSYEVPISPKQAEQVSKYMNNVQQVLKKQAAIDNLPFHVIYKNYMSNISTNAEMLGKVLGAF